MKIVNNMEFSYVIPIRSQQFEIDNELFLKHLDLFIGDNSRCIEIPFLEYPISSDIGDGYFIKDEYFPVDDYYYRMPGIEIRNIINTDKNIIITFKPENMRILEGLMSGIYKISFVCKTKDCKFNMIKRIIIHSNKKGAYPGISEHSNYQIKELCKDVRNKEDIHLEPLLEEYIEKIFKSNKEFFDKYREKALGISSDITATDICNNNTYKISEEIEKRRQEEKIYNCNPDGSLPGYFRDNCVEDISGIKLSPSNDPIQTGIDFDIDFRPKLTLKAIGIQINKDTFKCPNCNHIYHTPGIKYNETQYIKCTNCFCTYEITNMYKED